jgi:hypothetical protein
VKRAVLIGVAVVALLWLLSSINVNATVTAGDPTITYRGAN